MKELSIILQAHGEFEWEAGNWLAAWASRAISAGIITKKMCEPNDFQNLIVNTLNELTVLGNFKSWQHTFLDSTVMHVSIHYETNENLAEISQYIQERTGLKIQSAKNDNVELIVLAD